jgi:hypothetical protein
MIRPHDRPTGCPYRKSDPDVLVVQSAEMRLCEDPADTLHFARNRRVVATENLTRGEVT